MPTTSIIIVTYNCADVIYQNITSCIKEPNTETILIDNASTDGTLKQIESLKNDITLIRNNDNKGFTHACNQGIDKATGKYILLLNPDAWLKDGSLSLLNNFMDNNKKVGAIAPCLFYPNGNFQNYTRTFPTIKGLWIESFVPMRWWNKLIDYRKYTCQNIDFSVQQEVEQPAGAALLFRHQWKLDETYFIYGSDVDLCKKIILDGYTIIQTPKAKVFHHQSKGGTENNHLRMYLDIDNYYGMQYYFKKHNEKYNYFMYCFIFGVSLFIRALLSFILFSNDKIMRWKKFIFFIQHKNFTSYFNR